jgi:hypothetical protein
MSINIKSINVKKITLSFIFNKIRTISTTRSRPYVKDGIVRNRMGAMGIYYSFCFFFFFCLFEKEKK